MNDPLLHLLCGKIAAGKSTLAERLGSAERTVVISEDAWLNLLFAAELTNVQDYVRCSARLRSAIVPHVVSLLNAGVSVVLDFPANTIETRKWMRGLIDSTSVAHQFHVLDVPDHVCLARLRVRNAEGVHPYSVTEAQFHQVTKHFVPPTPEEGFNLVLHRTT